MSTTTATQPAGFTGKAMTARLIALSALAPFGMHLIVPALAPIQLEFGISTATASLMISATLWGIAIASLFFGVLSDRFGRRPMLFVGLSLYIGGSLLGMLGTSAAIVILGRVIQGIGGVTGMVVSRATVRDLYTRERATSVLAYLSTVVMIAPILAPGFSGFLVENFGWRSIFAVAGSLAAVVLAWQAAGFPETVKDPVPLPDFVALIGAYMGVLRSPVFLFYSLVTSSVFIAFFGMMSAVPYVNQEVWHLGKDHLGVYLGASGLGMMCSAFITARIAERVDLDALLLRGICCNLTAVVIAAALFAGGINHPLCLFGPALLHGFGSGFTLPTSTARALSAAPRMAGTASGMMTFMQFAVGALAAQAVGYFDHHTVWPIIGFMASGNLLAGFFALNAVARAKRMGAS